MLLSISTPAIVDVDAQGGPSREGISHRLASFCFCGKVESVTSIQALNSSRTGRHGVGAGTPLVSPTAADTVLDIVERADARQRFLRDR